MNANQRPNNFNIVFSDLGDGQIMLYQCGECVRQIAFYSYREAVSHLDLLRADGYEPIAPQTAAIETLLRVAVDYQNLKQQAGDDEVLV